MKIQHRPSHWVVVALALAAFLLTLTEAHGQTTGAAGVFEGRPAIAGAQGGLGAQAGVPQGGIGVQGSEVAERSVQQLRKPSGLDEIQQARREGTADATVAATDTDVTVRKEVEPQRDKSLAKDQRSAKKAVRGVKRSISRARHGTSPVDAAK
jgi:hypothetical protein